MRNSISRREALLGTGALSLSAAVAPSIAAMPEDPIIGLIDQYSALWPLCPGDDDEIANERWNAEITSLEMQISEVLPSTKAGALAAVRFIGRQVHCYAADRWMARALAVSADILARDA